MPLFVQGIEVRTNDGEVIRSIYSAEASGDFLLHFGHPDGAFTEIIGEGDRQVSSKAQDLLTRPC